MRSLVSPPKKIKLEGLSPVWHISHFRFLTAAVFSRRGVWVLLSLNYLVLLFAILFSFYEYRLRVEELRVNATFTQSTMDGTAGFVHAEITGISNFNRFLLASLEMNSISNKSSLFNISSDVYGYNNGNWALITQDNVLLVRVCSACVFALSFAVLCEFFVRRKGAFVLHLSAVSSLSLHGIGYPKSDSTEQRSIRVLLSLASVYRNRNERKRNAAYHHVKSHSLWPIALSAQRDCIAVLVHSAVQEHRSAFDRAKVVVLCAVRC
jgi:hypothetical protein